VTGPTTAPIRAAGKQKPAIGRTVHYQTGQHVRAAIVTDVRDEEIVDLYVIHSAGAFWEQNVPFAKEPKHGSWSWPPRV
jgi:hypothetical protein